MTSFTSKYLDYVSYSYQLVQTNIYVVTKRTRSNTTLLLLSYVYTGTYQVCVTVTGHRVCRHRCLHYYNTTNTHVKGASNSTRWHENKSGPSSTMALYSVRASTSCLLRRHNITETKARAQQQRTCIHASSPLYYFFVRRLFV